MTAPPEIPDSAERQRRHKPTREQRVVAFAFLGAFAATMVTVVLTGLYVRSPSSRRAVETPAVVLTIGEPRAIDLVFDAREPRDDAELIVDLPPGIELVGRPGEERVVSLLALGAGDNTLPLALVARDSRGGQLAAQLRAGEDRKTFVVDVAVR